MAVPAVTLLEILATQARERPEHVAFTFEGTPTTFAELAARVDAFALCLLARGLERGERVLLLLANGPAFFTAFFGVERAGGVPVPLYPGSGPERLRRLAALVGARRLVVADEPAPEVGLETLRLDDGPPSPTAALPAVAAADVAFLQVTSGSTGEPKAVVLRHAQVLANLGQLIAGFAITPADVFVSWLPVHHDMGLVLMSLVPLSLAVELVLLPTSLRHAHHWFAAIARHRGTFTAAPDFAWRYALRTTKDPGRFDLSSLRVALDAAEPVRASTLAEVERAFGLRPVMIAGYGLAEATVGVSAWPPGTPPKVDERGLVSVGKPFPEVEVEIVGDDGERAAAGETGEIRVRSPATTSGYFGDPAASAALFAGDAIRTGDLGYRDAAGDLFIVGRQKNVILHAGRNLAPQEIEAIVDALPAVRRSAALGLERGRIEGEQVYVFAEVRPRTSPEALAETVRETAARLHRELGVRPGRVYLLRPRSIPLTQNGKLRYPELRRLYLDGFLRREGRILFPDY